MSHESSKDHLILSRFTIQFSVEVCCAELCCVCVVPTVPTVLTPRPPFTRRPADAAGAGRPGVFRDGRVLLPPRLPAGRAPPRRHDEIPRPARRQGQKGARHLADDGAVPSRPRDLLPAEEGRRQFRDDHRLPVAALAAPRADQGR